MSWKNLSLSCIIAVVITAAFGVYGQVKPRCIEAAPLLTEYFQLLSSNCRESEMLEWLSTKSEDEISAVPIIIGSGLLNQIEGAPIDDSELYEAFNTALRLIEKGINQIDSLKLQDGLYLLLEDQSILPSRFVLANGYEKLYRYNEADSVYRLMCVEIQRDFGKDSEELVYWTNQAASWLNRKSANYSGALDLMTPALSAAIESKTVSDSTACNFLVSYAQKMQRSGNHKEAIKVALQAQKRTGHNIQLVFITSSLLGELYAEEGLIETSQAYFEDAARNAPDLESFFSNSINFANILCGNCRYEEAMAILEGIEKYLHGHGLSADAAFNFYETKGVLLSTDNPEESKKAFQEAERIINCVPQTNLIRHILNSQVYPNGDNSFKVISALDRAVQTYKLFVTNEPSLLNELYSLKGYYHLKIKDYAKARLYLELALDGMKDYAEGDLERLRVFRWIAEVEKACGNPIDRFQHLKCAMKESFFHGEESEIYLRAVSDMLELIIDEKDIEHIDYLLNHLKKYAPFAFDTRIFESKAVLLNGDYQECQRLLDSVTCDYPDRLSESNQVLQQLYIAIGSENKVCDISSEILMAFRNDLLRSYLFMSDSERRFSTEDLRNERDKTVRLIASHPSLSKTGLEYSLLTKGILFKTKKIISGLLSESDNATVDLQKIKQLRIELARAESMGDRKTAEQLKAEIISRERYVINDYVDAEEFMKITDGLTATSILKRLPVGAIGIDFVEYVSENNDNRLGAFIIRSNSGIKFIDLGQVSPDAMNFNFLWRPLLADIPHGVPVYFATDGILHNQPIEYLEGYTGEAVCETYEMHRVFHLADIRDNMGIGNYIQTIGISDHNSPLGEASSFDEIFRGSWHDLSGVETEIAVINQSLSQISQKITLRNTYNDEATEVGFKNLDGAPITTLHISTHGFNLSSQRLLEAAISDMDSDHHFARRMLEGGMNSISGLVLRNGQLSWNTDCLANDEDDLLTSPEIENLYFPNLNLTVLSACDTGLGETDAEGVWGLQRAFRIAGSSSLICSLNKVKDGGTADFMGEFYRKAAEGMSIHDAFYHARKELLHRDPSNKEVWSSFILIE